MAPGAAAHGPRLCDLCFLRRCFEADEGPPNCFLTLLGQILRFEGGYQWTGVLCGFEAAL
jgi:hypothetical protein